MHEGQVSPQVPDAHEPFLKELWHAAQGITALGLLVGLAVPPVKGLVAVVTGNARSLMAQQGVVAGGGLADGIVVKTPPIGIPGPVADGILMCIIAGIVTYMVLKWVCDQEWVKKKKKLKDCWHKKKWYNPFDWVRILVCVVKWVIRKVLEWVCKYVEAIVTVLTIICIIVVILVAVLA